MELLRKNIHMDRIRSRAVSQITLEDDFNVPEHKPDITSLYFEKGNVILDEVKPGTDYVSVRGRLLFQILYHTNEGQSSLVSLDGKLPFEERIYMQGITGSDDVTVDPEIEDINISIINSRKLNLQSVITLNSRVEELYDAEAPIGIYGGDIAEYRKTPLSIAQIAVSKKDIYRIKEEITLPSNYPNIFQILWSSVTTGDMDFRVMDGKINLTGEIRIFILYEGEGEDHPVRTYETTLPVSGALECHGCKEGMIADILCSISPQDHGQSDITIKPDYDGEERSIAIDLVLDILMKLYEEETLDIVTDLYGVTKEVEAISASEVLRRLLARVNGKTRINERVRIKSGGYGILQLLHSEGKVFIEEQEVIAGGIRVSGSLQLHIMYITGNDEMPYGSVQIQIPYEYTLEVIGMTPQDMSHVRGMVEQLQVTMLDGEEMDVKAILSFSTIVFQNIPLQLIQDIRVEELDSNVVAGLPGMAVYVVKPGDHLWNIGKKYYVPVETLRKINRLEKDELTPGQKLLIVKGL